MNIKSEDEEISDKRRNLNPSNFERNDDPFFVWYEIIEIYACKLSLVVDVRLEYSGSIYVDIERKGLSYLSRLSP